MRESLGTTALAVALSLVGLASAEDDLTSLSYISYLERYATVQPANQGDQLEALANMPLAGGDRIDTAREARVEVQLADGSTLWLNEYSSLSLDAIAFSRDSQSDRTVLYLAEGELVLEIPADALGEQSTRVDSPSATVYLDRSGLFRIGTLPDGGLRLEVLAGRAEASTASGGFAVSAGTTAEVSGGQVVQAQLEQTGDEFAVWVQQRRQPITGDSAGHVDTRYARQASTLDSYGSWVYVDAYDSWAWRPSVSVGWQPYTAGSWYWTPTGWAWLSYEPWGWLPYHYGSWWLDPGFGWVWSWGHTWSPAWVHWLHWPGYVGWCPAGYYDWWWWDRYGYYYGWHDWDRGHGGHGRPQPPRSDVMPRPPGRTLPAAYDGKPVAPRRVALGLEGRASLHQVDPAGWNVVRSDDFASPHLSRLVQRGEVAMRTAPETDAVVTSGPLLTERPTRESPRVGLERAFTRVDRTAAVDLSPVLARDGNIDPAVAMRLVETTTPETVGRRSLPTAPAHETAAARPTTIAASPAAAPSRRQAAPNIHRSTISTGGASSDAGRSVGSRPSTPSASPAPRTSAPLVGGTGPRVIAPSRDSSRPVGSPRSGSRLVPPRTSPGSTRQYSASGSSRPVIVPNSSPSRPSRQLVRSTPGGGSGPTYSPGSRPAPSAHAPTSKPPSSSGSSSATSARSSPPPSSPSSHASPNQGSKPRR